MSAFGFHPPALVFPIPFRNIVQCDVRTSGLEPARESVSVDLRRLTSNVSQPQSRLNSRANLSSQLRFRRSNCEKSRLAVVHKIAANKGGFMAQPLLESTLLQNIPTLESAQMVNAGGQKTVYKATIDGQPMALKLLKLPAEQTEDEEFDTDIDSAADRARREVEILDQVDVTVLASRGPLELGTFETPDSRWMYFTEEWIEGQNLRQMIANGPLSPHQVVRLGLDLVEAICWLAERGLIHRDIKPENIMWAVDRGNFVLLDPGIAFDVFGPSLTKLPAIVGTMPYVSPEQLEPDHKRDLDFRSDLFAVGVVLHETSTGHHPFLTPGTNQSELFHRIRNVTPVSVHSMVEHFPGTLSEIIDRFLGKRPHQRYRKCSTATEALEKAADQIGS